MKRYINRFSISSIIFGGVILAIGISAKPVHVPLEDYRPDYTQSKVDIHAARADEYERVKELYALALTIHCEAKGESYMGKLLVGEIIRNRKMSKRYPDSYHEVVYQPYQFSCHNKGNKSGIESRKAFASETLSESVIMSIRAAKSVMAGKQAMFPTNTMYYFSSSMDKPPKWALSAKLEKVETVGAHNFYSRP